MRNYKIEIQDYAVNQKLKPLCNAITFINGGTNTLTVNKLPLLPNQSLSIEGNENEIDTTDYNIVFPDATAGNLVYVIIKRFE